MIGDELDASGQTLVPAIERKLPGVNVTPLQYAAENGRFMIVDDLLDLGAKKDPAILQVIAAEPVDKLDSIAASVQKSKVERLILRGFDYNDSAVTQVTSEQLRNRNSTNNSGLTPGQEILGVMQKGALLAVTPADKKYYQNMEMRQNNYKTTSEARKLMRDTYRTMVSAGNFSLDRAGKYGPAAAGFLAAAGVTGGVSYGLAVGAPTIAAGFTTLGAGLTTIGAGLGVGGAVAAGAVGGLVTFGAIPAAMALAYVGYKAYQNRDGITRSIPAMQMTAAYMGRSVIMGAYNSVIAVGRKYSQYSNNKAIEAQMKKVDITDKKIADKLSELCGSDPWKLEQYKNFIKIHNQFTQDMQKKKTFSMEQYAQVEKEMHAALSAVIKDANSPDLKALMGESSLLVRGSIAVETLVLEKDSKDRADKRADDKTYQAWFGARDKAIKEMQDSGRYANFRTWINAVGHDFSVAVSGMSAQEAARDRELYAARTKVEYDKLSSEEKAASTGIDLGRNKTMQERVGEIDGLTYSGERAVSQLNVEGNPQRTLDNFTKLTPLISQRAVSEALNEEPKQNSITGRLKPSSEKYPGIVGGTDQARQDAIERSSHRSLTSEQPNLGDALAHLTKDHALIGLKTLEKDKDGKMLKGSKDDISIRDGKYGKYDVKDGIKAPSQPASTKFTKAKDGNGWSKV